MDRLNKYLVYLFREFHHEGKYEKKVYSFSTQRDADLFTRDLSKRLAKLILDPADALTDSMIFTSKGGRYV